MRIEVANLVEDGKTEDQIRAMFVARYGERILTEPEGVRRLFLYTVPALLTILALLGIMMYLKRPGTVFEGAALPMAFVGELRFPRYTARMKWGRRNKRLSHIGRSHRSECTYRSLIDLIIHEGKLVSVE